MTSHPNNAGRHFTCISCSQVFADMIAFEIHATGKWSPTLSKAVHAKRRCRSVAELRKLGLLKDGHGRWIRAR